MPPGATSAPTVHLHRGDAAGSDPHKITGYAIGYREDGCPGIPAAEREQGKQQGEKGKAPEENHVVGEKWGSIFHRVEVGVVFQDVIGCDPILHVEFSI
jgi:hypothetical protein